LPWNIGRTNSGPAFTPMQSVAIAQSSRAARRGA